MFGRQENLPKYTDGFNSGRAWETRPQENVSDKCRERPKQSW